ncbi:MAG: undecaprenyl/decaprenyl-phosphate alpha-N-acetylglucosaminyl 1-phosphate transferase [Peptostreptococcaceae bacterium]|nr:undecaprenyl/decaprenyl-phosphate alpha-N-acetylglucosaminyl 1-phosphate transferase [Peptostreptococcaceae bacterium]
MEIYILPIIIAAILTFIMTPMAEKLARKVGAMDVPKDDRRVHTSPIPRMGGLAIYLAFVATLVIFAGMDDMTMGIIIGSTMIVGVGIVDDIRGVSAKVKLLVQILAALVLVHFGVKIDFFTNFFESEGLIYLGNLSIPITVFWVVGITNTFNLIDGLDGLAAGISTISATTLSYIAFVNGRYEMALVTLILAGCCVGFLPFNFNPARIFMGDTGSLFLGFVLSAISIQGTIKGATALTMVLPILAMGLPIMDTTLAILRRIIGGRSIMEADKGHLHHKLLSAGLCQKRAVLLMYGISLMLGISAVLLMNSEYISGFAIIAATLVIAMIPVMMEQARAGKK